MTVWSVIGAALLLGQPIRRSYALGLALIVAVFVHEYVGDVTGLLSIPTAVLLAHRLVPGWLTDRSRRALLWFGLGAGLLVFPPALGLGPFDPYGWAGSGWLVFVVALVCWARGAGGAALVLAAAAVACRFTLLGSANLWDYALDPVLFLVAPFALLRKKARTRGPLDKNRSQVSAGDDAPGSPHS